MNTSRYHYYFRSVVLLPLLFFLKYAASFWTVPSSCVSGLHLRQQQQQQHSLWLSLSVKKKNGQGSTTTIVSKLLPTSRVRSRTTMPTKSTSLFMANGNNNNKNNILESLTSLFPSLNQNTGNNRNIDNGSNSNSNLAVEFLQALNQQNLDAALRLLADDCLYNDTQFYQSCVGKKAIERRLRLQAEAAQNNNCKEEQLWVVDDVAVDTSTNSNIGILYHKELIIQKQNTNSNNDSTSTTTTTILPNSRGCAMFHLETTKDNNTDDNRRRRLITRIWFVKEPETRGGENGLKLLTAVNKLMPKKTPKEETVAATTTTSTTATESASSTGTRTTLLQKSPPEAYFDAWNRRDMRAAVNVFVDDHDDDLLLQYEDTAFPDPFVGKAKLEEHLLKCANAFPPEFQIVVDAVAVGDSGSSSSSSSRSAASAAAALVWHFENGNGDVLPFTQGASFYKLDNNNQQQSSKILQGIDFIEPAVIKPAGLVGLFGNSFRNKLSQEPIRWLPTLFWIAYMYTVFFSNGILPGANALQLEARTWEEVINLSINFFFVSPLLQLPFSPSVHPMLEGVFNLLLSWAALFAGFLSDDRPRKPNLLPMFPIVVGMQFLTSAFLLPYLAVRSSETSSSLSSSSTTAAAPTTTIVSKDELPVVAQVAGESRVLPALMGLVGLGSILWFFFGRAEEYGADFGIRYASFVDLLSIDRVGSSFLVDLAIFALFQGWLVEDDLKRRGVQDGGLLEKAGQYVPFFGMVAYLLFRPCLPETNNEIDS